MKKALLILIFLFSVSFAIEEKPVKRSERPKTEKYNEQKDKDDDGIWDTFIKNILKRTKTKKTQKLRRKNPTQQAKRRSGKKGDEKICNFYRASDTIFRL